MKSGRWKDSWVLQGCRTKDEADPWRGRDFSNRFFTLTTCTNTKLRIKMTDGYEKTLERLKIIQSHLERKPRSGRLAGKVAIITGVGSLTGIGWVNPKKEIDREKNEGKKFRLVIVYPSLILRWTWRQTLKWGSTSEICIPHIPNLLHSQSSCLSTVRTRGWVSHYQKHDISFLPTRRDFLSNQPSSLFCPHLSLSLSSQELNISTY